MFSAQGSGRFYNVELNSRLLQVTVDPVVPSGDSFNQKARLLRDLAFSNVVNLRREAACVDAPSRASTNQ
jgi:hypothetical protein